MSEGVVPWDIDNNKPEEGWVRLQEFPDFLVNRYGDVWNTRTGKLRSIVRRDDNNVVMIEDVFGKRHQRKIETLINQAFPKEPANNQLDFMPLLIDTVVKVIAYSRDQPGGDLIDPSTRVEHVGKLQGYIRQAGTVHFWFQGFHTISINTTTHSIEVWPAS